MHGGACEPAVVFEGVRFAFAGTPVLEGFSLTVCARDFACVVGANGCGKTTFLRLVLGLLTPDAGTVRVFGQDPARSTPRIGYVPQYAQYDPQFPVRVLDVVMMGRLRPARRWGAYDGRDREAALEALRQVELADLALRPFRALSGGQRQRVLIARALAASPDLLLMDEPAANLDAGVEEHLYDLLVRLNETMTIIMASHDLGFVSQFVKTVICIRRQAIIHPTSAITGAMIQEIYGSDHRMIRHDHRCTDHEHEGGSPCRSS